MSPVSLGKLNAADSLRGIGSRYTGFNPVHLPIAGSGRGAILAAMQREGFSIGRIQPDNAFAVRDGEFVYLFVRPHYSGYRRLALRRFASFPADHDVDHVYARNLAAQTSLKYVLVALVPARINRQHGLYEQLRLALDGCPSPDVCYADLRMLDKILGRNSRVRRLLLPRDYTYDPQNRPDFGLTQKQRGRWNVAFGFDIPAPPAFLKSLRPLPSDSAQE